MRSVFVSTLMVILFASGAQAAGAVASGFYNNFSALRDSFMAGVGDPKYLAGYDFDGNGIVDVTDANYFRKRVSTQCTLLEFRLAFSSTPQQARYKFHCDLNDDLVIDAQDWFYFRTHLQF